MFIILSPAADPTGFLLQFGCFEQRSLYLAPQDRNAYKDKTLQTMVGAIDTIFIAAMTMVSVVVKTV
jgi:hypothetical protein